MSCITCIVFCLRKPLFNILTFSASTHKVTKLHLTMTVLTTLCSKVRIRTASVAVNPKVARRACFKKQFKIKLPYYENKTLIVHDLVINKKQIKNMPCIKTIKFSIWVYIILFLFCKINLNNYIAYRYIYVYQKIMNATVISRYFKSE